MNAKPIQFVHTACDGEDREKGEEWIGKERRAKKGRRKETEGGMANS